MTLTQSIILLDNDNMNLIVGLGNKGDKYLKSRHNVGFILLDEILGNSFHDDKYAEGKVFEDGNIVYLKPETFMNNSGISVKHVASKKNISSQDVVVIHDDIDLPFGIVKIVFASGAGGHNGVKSIIDHLNTNEFVRIKIGIAPQDAEGRAIKPKGGFFTSSQKAVANFVLKDFSKNDFEKIKALSSKIKKIIETISKEGKNKAMNEFN